MSNLIYGWMFVLFTGCNYLIAITTGDLPNAGTHAQVDVLLIGSETWTPWIRLNNVRDKFRRGK